MSLAASLILPPPLPEFQELAEPNSSPRFPGRTSRALDALSLQFVISSRTAKGPVLDFGCGEGIATAAALARGAHVCALDPDKAAIARLLARIPAEHHRRLRAHVGPFLGAEFEESRFEAVLAELVLPELDGRGVETVLKKFRRWLDPQGRLYLSALSPLGSFWSPVRAEYARRVAQGVRWPGYIENVCQFMGDQSALSCIHLFDEETLTCELGVAGFAIEAIHCYLLPWDTTQMCCAVTARCKP